jgi:hypothetical protein
MDLNPHDQARMMVVDYVTDRFDRFDLEYPLVYGDTCVTWFALTGKSWEALVIADGIKDTRFSVFYDSTDGRTYFDVYIKSDSLNFNQRAFATVGMTGGTSRPV